MPLLRKFSLSLRDLLTFHHFYLNFLSIVHPPPNPSKIYLEFIYPSFNEYLRQHQPCQAYHLPKNVPHRDAVPASSQNHWHFGPSEKAQRRKQAPCHKRVHLFSGPAYQRSKKAASTSLPGQKTGYRTPPFRRGGKRPFHRKRTPRSSSTVSSVCSVRS